MILMSGRRQGNRHMEGGQGKKQYTVTSARSIAKVWRELHSPNRNPVNPQTWWWTQYRSECICVCICARTSMRYQHDPSHCPFCEDLRLTAPSVKPERELASRAGEMAADTKSWKNTQSDNRPAPATSEPAIDGIINISQWAHLKPPC